MRNRIDWIPLVSTGLAALGVFAGVASAHDDGALPIEGRALAPRVDQDQVEGGELHLDDLRRAGLRVFATPFRAADGLGDGPLDPGDPGSVGGRPTLGDNGIFLRMNGLDSQTCLECHSVLSNAVIPASFAVGGVGGVAASAFPGVIDPDIDDSEDNGFAAISGRMINPPFVFGGGGVELVGREMTRDLQTLRARAEARPGERVRLVSKGIDFGEIVSDGTDFDVSLVEGIDADLVVRPFGRKGCCATLREFDVGAMQFHHGIQPNEVVGAGVDADGDGVADELLVGELSALHIFEAALEMPERRGGSRSSREGSRLFGEVGCEGCHVAALRTESRKLRLCFPEIPTDPFANIYFEIDLSRQPGFPTHASGIEVRMYSDLKRHRMGPGLAETTGDSLDEWFVTARLWGAADTAPYLHDGRATTLHEAIAAHGGEAAPVRDVYLALRDRERQSILEFLATLRTPRRPNDDLSHSRR